VSNPQDYGVVVGLVTDLNDPDGLGRVRVKFPHLGGKPSDWSRIVAPMAGKSRGAFFRPEVDDEVLVVFEQGDLRRPCIIGSMWSKVDPPPPDDNQPTKNNWRFIQSRSGHLIKLDDTDGQERIEIVGKGGKHKLVIDVSGSKIELSCDSGDLSLLAPQGKVSVQGQAVSIQASGDMSLEATGTMTIKGATVNIN
jgi:uncharacterized protein involved in type VI secretion and phage assembly